MPKHKLDKGVSVMNFSVSNIAQISKADIEFGDLTILLGAQATGKSIYLQLFKLWQDQGYIKKTMDDYGVEWSKKSRPELLRAYLGEGMEKILESNGEIASDKKTISFSPRITDTIDTTEIVYYIPAQRSLIMPDGWPTPFRAYSDKTPFVVRNFSEHIRLYLEKLKARDTLFPISGKLKQTIRDSLNDAIFHKAEIIKGNGLRQKELNLRLNENEDGISYIAWSTGQREFFPLLLGCYELLPAGRVKKVKKYKWVLIEEPEMGLHPKAISSVMTLVLDLISRGYKVVISTHSADIIDIVWAINTINNLKILNDKKIEYICKLLNFPIDLAPGSGAKIMVRDILGISMRTYFFEYNNDNKVNSMDISTLDPGDPNEKISGWGGLSGYSGNVADIISEAVSETEYEDN